MATSSDWKRSDLKKFLMFRRSLVETQLPGSNDATLQKKVYALAKGRIGKEEQAREAVHLSKRKYRPLIKAYRMAVNAANKAGEHIQRAHNIYANAMNIPPFECDTRFAPAKSAILGLIANLQSMEQTAIDQLLERHRKTGEEPFYPSSLLGPNWFLLPRLGWKPCQAWFIGLVFELLERYRDKKTKRRLDRRTIEKLIQAILIAAFNEHLSGAGVKIAVSRFKSRRKSQVPSL